MRMAQDDFTLSIIIVNFQSEERLSRCLAVLCRTVPSEISFETIIVNNDPGESLEKLWREYPEVRIFSRPKNLGFGAGNNFGAKKARGAILWFLNPDTEIVSKNLSRLVGLFLKCPEVGVVGGRLITEKDSIQPWAAGYELSLWELFRNNLGLPRSKKIWLSERARSVDWVAGTSLFIRRELFARLAGFDERFFMYFEDMDLCRRARDLGCRVVYLPFFLVRHFGGTSYRDVKKQKQHYYNSQIRYFRKYRSRLESSMLQLARKILRF